MLDDLIRPIAHHIWMIEGQPDGWALDHWLEGRRVALTDVAQPWHDAATLVDEATWMRRALWLPQTHMH
ncbi:DUF2934 domain-containing protein [Aureimonas glaciei]|uniref:Uncharacterized protein n=1 Tax=Aureimonas glaciei TaxID=1776957 RepID=A0A917DEC5_9HYPH|nr:DUF2934 domain-containing protein [Aureimonas glaciei]GGD31358.1 hypothetical protein GCM10011335_37990 [Aureimonas glaciei]